MTATTKPALGRPRIPRSNDKPPMAGPYAPPDQTDHWPAQEFGDMPMPAPS